MAEENSNSREEIDSELLTAYLDGELSDTDCVAVEKRLAEDPEFHRQMRELQSAWDMLDSLPLVQPDSHFVQTTVEMAIAGHGKRTKPGFGIIIKGLLILLLLGGLFGTSYFLTRESIEQPERELVKDLPLFENHDRYERVVKDDPESSIEFLRKIYKRGLFREVDDLLNAESKEILPTDLEPSSERPDPQLVKDRSDRLSRMTEQQRAELFEKKEKFESLDPEKQSKLREFHDLLAEEPDRSKLVDVLASYYDWLKILGMSQRANLLDMPLDERLKEIGRITRRQAQEAFGTIGSTKLPIDDAVLFYQWYDLSIQFYGPEIRERAGQVLKQLKEVKGLPTKDSVIDQITSGPIEPLVDFLMLQDRDYFGEILCNNAVSRNIGLDDLRKMVSGKARAIIDQPEFTQRDRRELILKWIESANRARFPIKLSKLRSFYDGLTPEKKDELDNLHPDERHELLTQMYWKEEIGQGYAPASDEDFQQYREFLRQNGFDAEFGTSNDNS